MTDEKLFEIALILLFIFVMVVFALITEFNFFIRTYYRYKRRQYTKFAYRWIKYALTPREAEIILRYIRYNEHSLWWFKKTENINKALSEQHFTYLLNLLICRKKGKEIINEFITSDGEVSMYRFRKFGFKEKSVINGFNIVRENI